MAVKEMSVGFARFVVRGVRSRAVHALRCDILGDLWDLGKDTAPHEIVFKR